MRFDKVPAGGLFHCPESGEDWQKVSDTEASCVSCASRKRTDYAIFYPWQEVTHIPGAALPLPQEKRQTAVP